MIKEQIQKYQPFNEQEVKDKQFILNLFDKYDDLFERRNPYFHFTASSWLVNKDRTKVVFAYHKIYDSWAWLGGHADGERDLAKVALKEAREESGNDHIELINNDIFSLEVLAVDGHVKKGEYLSSHLHLNLTYLLEIDDQEILKKKEDENTAVSFFNLDEVLKVSKEDWYINNIYPKLIKKTKILWPDE